MVIVSAVEKFGPKVKAAIKDGPLSERDYVLIRQVCLITLSSFEALCGFKTLFASKSTKPRHLHQLDIFQFNE